LRSPMVALLSPQCPRLYEGCQPAPWQMSTKKRTCGASRGPNLSRVPILALLRARQGKEGVLITSVVGASMAAAAGGEELACTAAAVRADGSRTTATLRSGRRVAVFRHRSRLYAMDAACYHHGGPLEQGDIEDFNGRPCVICPWHKYPITLDSGEGLYTSYPDGVCKTKGKVQRLHKVLERDGHVFVTENTSGPSLGSDSYATLVREGSTRQASGVALHSTRPA
jgi:nitrite reductase/ring-hydroxylating ferredoxin subunit